MILSWESQKKSWCKLIISTKENDLRIDLLHFFLLWFYSPGSWYWCASLRDWCIHSGDHWASRLRAFNGAVETTGRHRKTLAVACAWCIFIQHFLPFQTPVLFGPVNELAVIRKLYSGDAFLGSSFAVFWILTAWGAELLEAWGPMKSSSMGRLDFAPALCSDSRNIQNQFDLLCRNK